MTEQEFEQAVVRIRGGDKDGLKEIYLAYVRFIYAVIYEILQNKENTEDVTSEFFIKLWDVAERYEPGRGHRGYLATIARNMAIDFIRKHRREVLTADPDLCSLSGGTGGSMDAGGSGMDVSEAGSGGQNGSPKAPEAESGGQGGSPEAAEADSGGAVGGPEAEAGSRRRRGSIESQNDDSGGQGSESGYDVASVRSGGSFDRRSQKTMGQGAAHARGSTAGRTVGLSAAGSTVEDEVIGNIAIQEALAILKDGERQIINMKILGDMTFQEISDTLQMPMGTVTWKYRNAIGKLRRCGYEQGFEK